MLKQIAADGAGGLVQHGIIGTAFQDGGASTEDGFGVHIAIHFLMIVIGCLCDLVWHCWRKGNGYGKANLIDENIRDFLRRGADRASPADEEVVSPARSAPHDALFDGTEKIPNIGLHSPPPGVRPGRFRRSSSRGPIPHRSGQARIRGMPSLMPIII